MSSPSQLSFLPDDYMERKAQRRSNAVCAILFILVMGVLGGAFAMSEKATREVDEKYRRIDEQYVKDAKRLQQFKLIQEKHKRMAQQADITSSLVERVQRNFILAEFTNSLVPGVSLMELELASKPRAKAVTAAETKTAYEQKRAAAAGKTAAVSSAPEPKKYDVSLKLTGVAKNDQQVAEYLRLLSLSPMFKDVNLVVSEEYAIEGEKGPSSVLPATPAEREQARLAQKKEAEKEIVRKFQIEMMLNPDAEVTARDVARVSSAVATLEEAPGK